MAELGVRNELAVENQRGADASAQRGGDDEAILALRGAELLLGKTGGVSVVHHGDRTTASFGEHFGDVHADPGLVQVGHVAKLLAHMNRSREGDADRSGLRNLEMLELLANDFADGLRSGHLRGEDLQTRFGELALLEVNRGGLNAGATNVNAECLCSLNHLQPLYQGMLRVYSNRYVLW